MANNIRFEDNSRIVLNEMETKKKLILKAIGLKAVSIWQKIITLKKVIDTGTFRNSCASEVGKDYVIIGNPVEYATWLEIGTSKMSARPTLTPTILEYSDSYELLAKQIMKQ